MTSPSSKEATNSTESSDSVKSNTEESSIEEPIRKSGFIPLTMEELKLVVWPSRQQLFSESIAVILMVTLSAAAIAAISRFYSWGASHIFP